MFTVWWWTFQPLFSCAFFFFLLIRAAYHISQCTFELSQKIYSVCYNTLEIWTIRFVIRCWVSFSCTFVAYNLCLIFCCNSTNDHAAANWPVATCGESIFLPHKELLHKIKVQLRIKRREHHLMRCSVERNYDSSGPIFVFALRGQFNKGANVFWAFDEFYILCKFMLKILSNLDDAETLRIMSINLTQIQLMINCNTSGSIGNKCAIEINN